MNCEKNFFEKFYKSRGRGERRTQIQILESNHELPKKIFFFEKFSKSRGGRGEVRTQSQILESNHELPKKNFFRKNFLSPEGGASVELKFKS